MDKRKILAGIKQTVVGSRSLLSHPVENTEYINCSTENSIICEKKIENIFYNKCSFRGVRFTSCSFNVYFKKCDLSNTTFFFRYSKDFAKGSDKVLFMYFEDCDLTGSNLFSSVDPSILVNRIFMDGIQLSTLPKSRAVVEVMDKGDEQDPEPQKLITLSEPKFIPPAKISKSDFYMSKQRLVPVSIKRLVEEYNRTGELSTTYQANNYGHMFYNQNRDYDYEKIFGFGRDAVLECSSLEDLHDTES